MKREVSMVRIHCSEKNGLHHDPLTQLHEPVRVAGATAFRGIAGFGGAGRMHEAGPLDLGMDLPIIIEFFDLPDKVGKTLQHLQDKVAPGHIATRAAQANLD